MSEPVLVLWSLVTPSHEGLTRDFFLRTLPADCRSERHRVDAAPVVYGAPGWQRVVVHKFDLLERAFDAHPDGEVFVLSDVDIRFYRPFAADLRRRMAGLDLLFQDNRPGEQRVIDHLCTGFVGIRSGPGTRELFRRARAIVAARDTPRIGDQRATIQALRESRKPPRVGFLPPAYFVPFHRGEHWRPGALLAPPDDIVLHHANWTYGNELKREQLEAVERIIAARASAGGADGESSSTRARQA